MDLKDFQSGNYIPQGDYKAFSPAPINHVWMWTNPLVNILLEEATAAVGELNAFSRIVPNVHLFIRMHIVKEATDSSRIEGTKTAIDQALLDRDSIAPELQDDWEEVQNYIQAMNFAVDELQRLPLSNRLIKETHRVLMSGVRGQNKAPGEFRKVQNWIGGRSPDQARFVPPAPNEVLDLMSDLEAFLHNSAIHVPHLIRAAIAHYQFETIHPFLDGNGRTGRLLITLYLISQGVLDFPTLYLSDYLEQKRQEYFDTLNAARSNNDLERWIIFFLGAVADTAHKGNRTFKAILQLRNEIEDRAAAEGKRRHSIMSFFDYLFQNPTVKLSNQLTFAGLSNRNIRRLFQEFEREGYLKELTGYSRNQIYTFQRYLDLFMDLGGGKHDGL